MSFSASMDQLLYYFIAFKYIFVGNFLCCPFSSPILIPFSWIFCSMFLFSDKKVNKNVPISRIQSMWKIEKSDGAVSSGSMTQLHPYQYLSQLNSIYNTCNGENAKSHSSICKVKLKWKPFSIIKIPNFYELTYEKSHKGEKNHKSDNLKEQVDENEKKIWKQHQQILKRYSKNLTASGRREFVRPQTCKSRTSKQNETKQGHSHQASLLIQKLMNKGVKVDYNKQQIKDEVLKKLRKIQAPPTRKQTWRAQSALSNAKRNQDPKLNQQNLTAQAIGEMSFINAPYVGKERKDVEQNEYLKYEKSADIISSYKTKISQVDCALSELNVRKTAKILRNMQNIVSNLD